MSQNREPTASDHEAFVAWLATRLIDDARGTRVNTLKGAGPAGRFWLGRLSPEEATQSSRLGARGERLDPCAAGVRFQPSGAGPWRFPTRLGMAIWVEASEGAHAGSDREPPEWNKIGPIAVEISVDVDPASVGAEPRRVGQEEIAQAVSRVMGGGVPISAALEVEVVEPESQGQFEVVLTVVNTSPAQVDGLDTNLYEVELAVDVDGLQPYVLEAIPDSFRYNRTIPAYGINGGVEVRQGTVYLRDAITVHQPRPTWRTSNPASGRTLDFRFSTLAADPLPAAEALFTAMGGWSAQAWSEATLNGRAAREGWSPDMRRLATEAAAAFDRERSRTRMGIDLLAADPLLRSAFQLANRAFDEVTRRPGLPAFQQYDSWRAFQLGFLLASLPSLSNAHRADEAAIVDTLHFATGGGKTETYLCLILVAAFVDRLSGKQSGISAWSRFPLRMLSLQQTQRFADILAAAELVRRAEGIPGDSFTLGYLVGQAATPNEIPLPSRRRAWEPDADDPDMPWRYRVLLRCPFCGNEGLEMTFTQATWTLDHVCKAQGCAGRGRLPLRVVDREIFRFLPTVVVGTLDKVASLGLQAAMRGLYGPPLGVCPEAHHGFTYAQGCLFPGCGRRPNPLPQDPALFAPRLRIQDELHLLRDSLGATDSHYESILDHLQAQTAGLPAKVIASSATLSGYEDQASELYLRQGRIFPVAGPRTGESFWAEDSDQLARRFLGVAPRGVTLEYAAVRATEALQEAVRFALDNPTGVAPEAGLSDHRVVPALVDRYGTHVVYGTTLRDIEATARTFETQVRLEPLDSRTLTGRVPFDEVREILGRLERPEPDFADRLHLIAASSMLSHGVDVDRMNVMTVLGIPLTTAEFIQTTSRVGRRWPGLIIVLHKVLRERDASVFRYFNAFVTHGDRLIEPVPVTRRSRRVLELTYPGLFMARLLGIHEAHRVAGGGRRLWYMDQAFHAVNDGTLDEANEFSELSNALGFTGALDEGLLSDLQDCVRRTFRAISTPGQTGDVRSALPGEPMLSLRDVEDQVPIEDLPSRRHRGRTRTRA